MPRKFAQGKFNIKNPAKYMGNKTPMYRSGWEFAFMKMCDENPAIVNWASEAIKIPYRNPLTGKQTIYVPDFFITYMDRTGKTNVELIEVKPANQSIKEQVGKSRHNQAHYILNQAKWDVARAWCKQQGIVFRVINEGDIFHTGRRK
jgi:hypothetical protein